MAHDRDSLHMDGLVALGQLRIDDAIAAFDQALALAPDDVEVLLALSMAHSKKGDQDKAIELATRASEIDPTDPFPHTNLSMFYQKKGMTEVAEDHSARVTQLNLEAQRRAGGT